MTNSITSLTEIFKRISEDDKALDFDAQILAALMLQSNALIPIKMVTRICSISRPEINRRIYAGTFPKPIKISPEENSVRKAFRVQDIQKWLKDPQGYIWSTSSLQNSYPHK